MSVPSAGTGDGPFPMSDKYWTEDWRGTCPVCKKVHTCENVSCNNCDKPGVFRIETTCLARTNGDVTDMPQLWSLDNCYLGCRECAVTYAGFPCSDCYDQGRMVAISGESVEGSFMIPSTAARDRRQNKVFYFFYYSIFLFFVAVGVLNFFDPAEDADSGPVATLIGSVVVGVIAGVIGGGIIGRILNLPLVMVGWLNGGRSRVRFTLTMSGSRF